MLPKSSRLSLRKPFHEDILTSTELFVFKAKNNLENISRFGFIVGKRVDKRATVRNQTKRIIRSCIENKLEQVATGYDMLFILKKALLSKDREKACKQVHDALIKKGLFRNNYENSSS